MSCEPFRCIGLAEIDEEEDIIIVILSLSTHIGTVTEDDLEAIDMEEDVSVTNFTNGNHFYEEVEDKKDSVWLVQVQLNSLMSSALSNDHWKTVRKKMSLFGIRAGLFDCSTDWRYCY